MKSIFDSQVTSTFQIMTLFNIELFITLESSVFDPYRFPCSPQADACVASWNTPLGPLYLYPSHPFWTLHWFVSCMKSSLSIRIHHLISYASFLILRQHMHINSCLIHVSLACFHCTTIFISYDKSFQFETMQQHIMSHSHNLNLSYESNH